MNYSRDLIKQRIWLSKINLYKNIDLNIFNEIIDLAFIQAEEEFSLFQKNEKDVSKIREDLDTKKYVTGIFFDYYNSEHVINSKRLGLEDGLKIFHEPHAIKSKYKSIDRKRKESQRLLNNEIKIELNAEVIVSSNVKFLNHQIEMSYLRKYTNIKQLDEPISKIVEKDMVRVTLNDRRKSDIYTKYIGDEDALIMDLFPSYCIENFELIYAVLINKVTNTKRCKIILSESCHASDPLLYVYGRVLKLKIIDIQHGFFGGFHKNYKHKIYDEVWLNYPSVASRGFFPYRYNTNGVSILKEQLYNARNNIKKRYIIKGIKNITQGIIYFISYSLRECIRKTISKVYIPKHLVLLPELGAYRNSVYEMPFTLDQIISSLNGKKVLIRPHPIDLFDVQDKVKKSQLSVLTKSNFLYGSRIESKLWMWSYSTVISFGLHSTFVPWLIKGRYRVLFVVTDELRKWYWENMTTEFVDFFSDLMVQNFVILEKDFKQMDHGEIKTRSLLCKRYLKEKYKSFYEE
jgi:hypothetical protein